MKEAEGSKRHRLPLFRNSEFFFATDKRAERRAMQRGVEKVGGIYSETLCILPETQDADVDSDTVVVLVPGKFILLFGLLVGLIIDKIQSRKSRHVGFLS